MYRKPEKFKFNNIKLPNNLDDFEYYFQKNIYCLKFRFIFFYCSRL